MSLGKDGLERLVRESIQKYLPEEIESLSEMVHLSLINRILLEDRFSEGAVVEVPFTTKSKREGYAELLFKFNKEILSVKATVLKVYLEDKALFSAIADEDFLLSVKDEPLIIFFCPKCKSMEIVKPGHSSNEWGTVYVEGV